MKISEFFEGFTFNLSPILFVTGTRQGKENASDIAGRIREMLLIPTLQDTQYKKFIFNATPGLYKPDV